MKTFEIQRYDKGKWLHDSYFDTGEQAVTQAKHMAQSDRYDGIRVVEDEFTDGSALSKAKLLFVSRPNVTVADPKKKARNVRRPPPQEIDRPPRAQKARAKAKGSSSMYGIVGMLVALVVIGLAAHYGLQTAFR